MTSLALYTGFQNSSLVTLGLSKASTHFYLLNNELFVREAHVRPKSEFITGEWSSCFLDSHPCWSSFRSSVDRLGFDRLSGTRISPKLHCQASSRTAVRPLVCISWYFQLHESRSAKLSLPACAPSQVCTLRLYAAKGIYAPQTRVFLRCRVF